MSTRFLKLLLFAGAALLAACAQQQEKSAGVRSTAPTEIVRATSIPNVVAVAGTVRSATTATLAAKVIGNVTRVLVSEGDRVRAGQVLLEIDSRESFAAADRARAGVTEVEKAIDGAAAAVQAAAANDALAQTTLKRYAALHDRASVSPQEFDDVQAKARVAAAELERAKRGYEQALARRTEAKAGLAEAETFAGYSSVRAPLDGVVTARFVDPGSQAAPGMPLLTVEDPASMRVEATVSEDLASQTRPGDPVAIEIGGKRIDARITRVVPAVDPATRSALVKIDLPQSSIRSGSYARVLLNSGTREAIAVPVASITSRGSLDSVMVLGSDSIARMRLITLGDRIGDRVEVLSGLDAGERIVR